MPADLRRQRIGMMFIRLDSSTGTARSVAAADTTRPDCRRRVHGRQMSGGKGAKGGKGGNLESAGKTGPADDVATRRKPAETGGNSFWGPYSGAKVFSGAGIEPPCRAVGDWRIACGNCGNSHEESRRRLVSALQHQRPEAPLRRSYSGAKEFSVAAVRARAISCRTSAGSAGFRRARPQATVLDRGRGRTYFAAPQKRP
jgi:hypothetical protein